MRRVVYVCCEIELRKREFAVRLQSVCIFLFDSIVSKKFLLLLYYYLLKIIYIY